jgi:phosphonate transport system substrate-binding protein
VSRFHADTIFVSTFRPLKTLAKPSLCAALMLATLVLVSCGGDKQDPDLTGWRKEVGQIRVGVNISEDSDVTLARWTTFKDRLQDATGLKTTVFQATDYNGIIQAMASGQLELAQFGASSYANARDQMGTKIEPILTNRFAEGLAGYYSVIVVRADSPYRTIDDLKGKSIGYVDFNSMSGYLFPRMTLKKQGKDPDTFFGKSTISGGHSQGILGLGNGQFDAVFALGTGGTPETGFTNGSLWTLARNGMVDLSNYRVIWTAGPMMNSPYAIRTDRPQAFQDIMRGAMAAMAYDEPKKWVEIGLLDGSDVMAVSSADYQDAVDMRKTEIAKRRGKTDGEVKK